MVNNVRKYKTLLTQENDKTNLVSRKTIAEEIDMHIEDSQKVFARWQLKNQKIIDVGSGAGFPGMIMALHDQVNKYVLLEAELKKCQFLLRAVELLGMNHVQVIRGRAEEIGHKSGQREQYDVSVSRAVSAMRVVVEYCLPFVRVGGMVLLWKGPRYAEEMEQSQRALQALGGKVEDIYLYKVGKDRQRAIILIRKQIKTPDKYPRRIGIPAKRPL